MADGNNSNGNLKAGGSGLGHNNVIQQQVFVDPAQQNAVAQLTQQIHANTNVTLKQFHSEKGKDTASALEFNSRIDQCQVSNDWNDITFANFWLCLCGEAEEWLTSTVCHLGLTAAQKTWTRIRPLFKKEFATISDNKIIVDVLANLAHRPNKNPRKFFSPGETFSRA